MDMNNAATLVRNALKNELGLNSRKVSVRMDGRAVDVTIKDPTVSISDVKEVALRFRNTEFCESSLDILGGTIVLVQYECVW